LLACLPITAICVIALIGYISSRSVLFSRETFYPLTQIGISAVLILFGCWVYFLSYSWRRMG